MSIDVYIKGRLVYSIYSVYKCYINLYRAIIELYRKVIFSDAVSLLLAEVVEWFLEVEAALAQSMNMIRSCSISWIREKPLLAILTRNVSILLVLIVSSKDMLLAAFFLDLGVSA